MNKFIVVALAVLFPMLGYSQQFQQLSISVLSESISLPFSRFGSFNPGLEMAGTIRMKEKTGSLHHLNLRLGFFHHKRIANAIYLGGEYQYSKKLLQNKVTVDLPIGLGYLHTFYPGELYEQDENGDFEVVDQAGRAHLYFNLGFGLTYRGDRKVQPFIRHELLVQTPFANGIPILPHSLTKIGVQFKL